MASSVQSTYFPKYKSKVRGNKNNMSGKEKESLYDDDFDFVEAYDEDPAAADERMLPENEAVSAISCAFLGVGGGGGKLAKAFLDLGFNKTLLINTTEKDQPDGIPEEHFLLIPGADGVGKDVELGKDVLGNNGALVEDFTQNPDRES